MRSFETVCRMVGAGVRLGLVPRSLVPSGGLREPPTVVELDEPWAQRDLQVCVRSRAALSGFAAALVVFAWRPRTETRQAGVAALFSAPNPTPRRTRWPPT